MLDVVTLALGLGFFLVAVGYAHACERLLRRTTNDFRLFTRRSRRRGIAVLPDLRAAAAGAVLTAEDRPGIRDRH